MIRPHPPAQDAATLPPLLGVVIVSFNSAGVILDCLESLLAAPDVRLRIVVVDNCSADTTVPRLVDWAAGRQPYDPPTDLPFLLTPVPKPLALHPTEAMLPADAPSSVTLIEAPVNAGFAAGVNLGLAHLARDPTMQRFWILNPDSAVPPATPRLFATAGNGAPFALMGGRITYYDMPGTIQIDGGRIDRRTGVTHNINRGRSGDSVPGPAEGEADFVSGASMVASRAFYEAAGPMREDYFLYYEEVDWALRRGALPLAWCEGAVVHHRAGTAIGSVAPGRVASPFSIYFLHRGRMRFTRRFLPGALPLAYAHAVAKAGHYLLAGHAAQAGALLRAAHGLGPPAAVRALLTPEAARLAFG